jgi:hypothetical protein
LFVIVFLLTLTTKFYAVSGVLLSVYGASANGPAVYTLVFRGGSGGQRPLLWNTFRVCTHTIIGAQ